MFAMIYVTLCFMLLQVTYSLNVHSEVNRSGKTNALRRVLENIVKSNMFLEKEEEQPQGLMYDMLAKQLQEEESKKNKKHRHQLRSLVTVEPFTAVYINTEHAELVEKELKDTEGKHTSMLLHKAYVEKKGMNDFLVLQTGVSDPFVTVIPNDIYYNPGPKICVNWLDECSIQGIRARLLHRVRSP